MAERDPQNCQRGLDGVIGRYEQLSLNKFFDSGTPFMTKGRDGEEIMITEEKNDRNSGH